jgi:4-amino-4-deoxy-L-arabinose transferase-like glycosyltransferase
MVERQDWLTPHFGSELWFEKPPLSIWATALFFHFFEPSTLWARASSAISAVLVVIVTYLLGSHLYGRHVGLITAIPLLTSFEYIKQARNGTTDIMLTLFIMLNLYAYYRLRQNSPKWWYLFWLSFALGFMTKSWAMLIVLIVVAITYLFDEKLRAALWCRQFYWGLGLAVSVILPWHLVMFANHGEVFIDRYIFFDLLGRSTTALEGNIGGPRYYFDRFQHDFAPWFLVVPVALAISILENVSNQTRTLLLLVFTICIFGLYSLFVQTKIFHYLTPIYPVLAILLAAIIAQAWQEYRSPAFGGLVFAAIAATLVPSLRVVVIFVILSGFLIFGTKVSAYLVKRWAITNQEEGQYPLLYSLPKKSVPTIVSLSQPSGLAKIAVVLICVFLMSIGLLRSRPLYQIEMSPVERIVRLVNETDRDRHDPIIALALPPNYQDAIVGPTAMFYSDRPVKVAWSTEELDVFVSMGIENIMMAERFLGPLAEEYQITILAKSEPFIYGTIHKHGQN